MRQVRPRWQEKGGPKAAHVRGTIARRSALPLIQIMDGAPRVQGCATKKGERSPPQVGSARTSIQSHVGSAHGAPHREGEDRRPEYDRDTDDQQPVIPLGPPARRQGRILVGLQEFSIGMLATGCGAHMSGSWLADGRTAETLRSYETTAIAVTFQEGRPKPPKGKGEPPSDREATCSVHNPRRASNRGVNAHGGCSLPDRQGLRSGEERPRN
jgi:hypothetical protein